MPAKWRSVAISGTGDRRDEDIRRQTEILGDAFDKVVIYEGPDQRGRPDGGSAWPVAARSGECEAHP